MVDLKRIDDLKKEIGEYEQARVQASDFLVSLRGALVSKQISKKEYDQRLYETTNGKSEDEFINSYDRYIKHLRSKLPDQKNVVLPVKPEKVSQIVKPAEVKHLPQLDIDNEAFRRFIRSKKKKKETNIALVNYVLYHPSGVGRFANTFFGDISLSVSKKYGESLRYLFDSVRAADLGILNKTYLSMMFLFSIAGFILFLFTGLFLFDGILLRILNSFLLGVSGLIIIFFSMYYYPAYVKNQKRKSMKADFPFVVVHMAAVAGSGAQPISMFNLVLSAEEYKALEPEIKKVINYVNLFGYNLTTSLRLVAARTPLRPFQELLSGIVTTIETGGDLKNYLSVKADEALSAYETERKKFLQTLSTFSDVYIGVTLAAPMMLFVLLAIINTPMLGGNIVGLTAGTIAVGGTFVVIPLLHILFIVIVGVLQPA
ncbi:MAG: type II secretion system F family protein [Nanoarchaeota archaeon]